MADTTERDATESSYHGNKRRMILEKSASVTCRVGNMREVVI